MNFAACSFSLVNGTGNNLTDSGGSGRLAAPEGGWNSCWKCSLKRLYIYVCSNLTVAVWVS